jgi:hypothetical protein
MSEQFEYSRSTGHARDCIAAFAEGKNAMSVTGISSHGQQSMVEKRRVWLDETLPQVPPGTTLGKDLHYLDQQWPRRVRYLDDGELPIDNNRCENAMRPFAVGRRYGNHAAMEGCRFDNRITEWERFPLVR